MYYIYPIFDRLTTVFQSEFLDDIEEWFNYHDAGRIRYGVVFFSLED